MPGYRKHLMGGAVSYGVCLALLLTTHVCTPTIFTCGEWLAFALSGSLFPDIDIKSKGQEFFYWLIFLSCLFLFFNGQYKIAAIVSIISAIPPLVRHRGMFHRVWFVVGFPLIVAYGCSKGIPHYTHMFFIDAIFFSAGALSHLWLDYGTRRMFQW